MKKILFYNWIPFDEKEGKGGGVTIYTKNLIRYFVDDTDWEVYFLSSGREYDLLSTKPRIRQTVNEYGKKCTSYEIVNSPVFSSARISFSFPERLINDKTIKEQLVGFIKEQGGFDVIHFQNFEGLPVSVLKLKDSFPQTKFVYSLHNYYLFCPQVMLWKGDRENCDEDHCGEACFECMSKDVYAFKVRLNQHVARCLSDNKHGICIEILRGFQKTVEWFADLRTKTRRFSDAQIERYGKNFRKIEEQNIDCVNKYIDVVLAVSKRVVEIAIKRGINRNKIVLSYIGTEVAKNQRDSQKTIYDGSVLRICYLGYMRTMKGFYFLLDALENMHDNMAASIAVVIASPGTDENAIERIKKLESRFADITYYNGYTHDDLDMILKDVHLGIVPPLWEDNLPQVAVEMKAKGVAVLSSDLGGAKELSDAEEFVFCAGNRDSLYEKIQAIISCPSLLDLYWKKQKRLITMEEHIRQLEDIYSKM